MFIGGLDLGQAGDPSALAINEVEGDPAIHKLRELIRYPLGTSYPDIVDMVHDTWRKHNLGDSILCVDYTGVGRPIVDIFLHRAEIPIRAICITSGSAATETAHGWNVPKRDLCSIMQILLRRRRFQVAKGLREGEMLMKELQNFKAKISLSGNDTYEAHRSGDHDDLVLAAAMACWLAERFTLGAWGGGGSAESSRSLTADFDDFGPGQSSGDEGKPIWERDL